MAKVMNIVRDLTRNPVTVYLRFLLESAINRRNYEDFQQGYMARVVGCEIEPHVRIYPKAEVAGCRIGGFSYVSGETIIARTDIGRFCSIGPGCRIGLGTHPARTFVSTSPVFFSTARQCGSTFVTRDCFEESARIVVGNDVWIGANVTIVDGVRIGDGAIVAAGALLVSDVPSYAIFGGVPARLLRLRFSAREIEWLTEFQWWNRSESWIRQHHGMFRDIKRFMEAFGAGTETTKLSVAGA